MNSNFESKVGGKVLTVVSLLIAIALNIASGGELFNGVVSLLDAGLRMLGM